MNDVIFKQIILPNGRKKYVPYGIEVNDLPTGIYFVDVIKHSKETVSCSYLGQLYKVGEPKEIDLTEICGMHHLANEVIQHKDFIEFTKKANSTFELVAKTIAIINSLKKEK